MRLLENWLLAWIELAAAVVSIVTVGTVWPQWSFRYCAWMGRRQDDRAARSK